VVDTLTVLISIYLFMFLHIYFESCFAFYDFSSFFCLCLFNKNFHFILIISKKFRSMIIGQLYYTLFICKPLSRLYCRSIYKKMISNLIINLNYCICMLFAYYFKISTNSYLLSIMYWISV